MGPYLNELAREWFEQKDLKRYKDILYRVRIAPQWRSLIPIPIYDAWMSGYEKPVYRLKRKTAQKNRKKGRGGRGLGKLEVVPNHFLSGMLTR